MPRRLSPRCTSRCLLPRGPGGVGVGEGQSGSSDDDQVSGLGSQG